MFNNFYKILLRLKIKKKLFLRKCFYFSTQQIYYDSKCIKDYIIIPFDCVHMPYISINKTLTYVQISIDKLYTYLIYNL